jgi:hypothetical protein
MLFPIENEVFVQLYPGLKLCESSAPRASPNANCVRDIFQVSAAKRQRP